jgi:hypothetical protein
VSQEPRLDVFRPQRLAQQGMVLQVDLADRQVVSRTPVAVQVLQTARPLKQVHPSSVAPGDRGHAASREIVFPCQRTKGSWKVVWPRTMQLPRSRPHGRKRLCNADIHALRRRVERTFAWEDTFKAAPAPL